MEKTEVKRQNIFNVDFTRKKVADKDVTEAIIVVVTTISAFFIGRTELFGMMSILPAAFVFSFICESRRFYGVWAGAFLGILLSGSGDLWRYTAILVFAMAVDAAAKDGSSISPIRKAVLCSVSVIITGVFKYIAIMRLDFIVFITAIEAIIGFLSTIAFSGVTDKNMVDKEIYVCFLLCSVAAGIGGIKLLGIDLFLAVSVFLIMYFCKAKGMPWGVVMATLLGLAALCTGYGSISLFSAFSTMGLFGGLFGFMGKKGVIGASVFTGIAMLFYIGGDFLSVYTAISFAIAAFVFAIAPVYAFNEKERVLADSGYDVFKDISAKRMESVGEAIESISAALDTASAEVSQKERIDRIIDSTVSCVCGDCGLNGYCWGSEIENTYRDFYGFTGESGKNGRLTEKDISQDISKICVKIKKIVEVTNRNLDFYRQDMVWEGRIKEYKAADRKRMDILGKVLGELSFSIKNDYKPDKRLTEKIIEAVKNETEKKVKLQAYTVNGISGVYAIGAGIDISDIIGRVTGRKYALTGSSSNGEEADIYTSLPEFKASFAVSSKAKTGNNVTGDAFGDVCMEKGIGIILSDGMGTGEEAGRESARTVELAESFLKASLNGDRIKELLDTVFSPFSECFATVDLLETDLYKGNARFTKMGASPSFVLRDGKIKTIGEATVFASMASADKADTKELSLKDGDIIIMITDGVTEALTDKDEALWISDIVTKLDSRDPKYIADSIIKEAEGIRGIASDDMTAVVMRIWKPL